LAPTGYVQGCWSHLVAAIIAVAPELNIDLGHLEVLGLGRNAADKQRGRHQHPAASAVVRAIFIVDSCEKVSRFIPFRFQAAFT
jgi:hypothetical protein